MNTRSASRKNTLSGGICLFVLTGAAFAIASGCSKSEAATKPGVTHESASVAAGAKSETETYVAEIKAHGPYKAGAEGTVEVVLATKGAYHTNAQYPYKFKVADPAPEGVKYPKPLLKRADGAFEEKKASFKVPFSAAKPGKYKVGGKLSLSVCSEANCIMDRVDLETEVEVK
jgi:hypothetical protein